MTSVSFGDCATCASAMKEAGKYAGCISFFCAHHGNVTIDRRIQVSATPAHPAIVEQIGRLLVEAGFDNERAAAFAAYAVQMAESYRRPI
jgi:hypothetical protein